MGPSLYFIHLIFSASEAAFTRKLGINIVCRGSFRRDLKRLAWGLFIGKPIAVLYPSLTSDLFSVLHQNWR